MKIHPGLSFMKWSFFFQGVKNAEQSRRGKQSYKLILKEVVLIYQDGSRFQAFNYIKHVHSEFLIDWNQNDFRHSFAHLCYDASNHVTDIVPAHISVSQLWELCPSQYQAARKKASWKGRSGKNASNG